MKKLAYIGPAALNKSVTAVEVSTWDNATAAQKAVAEQREDFIKPILAMRQRGIHFNVAVRHFMTNFECELATEKMQQLAERLGRGSLPSRSTLHQWVCAYEKEGRTGLLPKHTGRVRKDYGWEAAAIAIYNRPGKPSMAAVARELREQGGFVTATDKAVRGYLKSLPAQLGDKSPMRLGKHLYNNSQKQFIHRSTDDLPVGALYQGDGHTIDVYLAHPVTQRLWRAELTAWMDIRSRYIVGWHLSEAESAISTIFSLSHTFSLHDHVPLFLYIDNGSGFKAKFMTDECTGFYKRMGIDVIPALPGNAKAKGNIERWFRTMERDFNQRWGDAYCGENMAERVSAEFCARYNAQLDQHEKHGTPMTLRLPTRTEWCEKFTEWLGHYHNRPHPEEPNTTPARLWGQLEKYPVHLTGAELLRPQIKRTVQREAVRLDNRWYFHPVLRSYNGHELTVEFDLFDDSMVCIRDEQGRMICDAALIKKRSYLPGSRIEEAKEKRKVKQLERLDRKRDELIRRSAMDIVGVLHGETLEHFADTALLEDNSAMDGITLDIHDDHYLND